jgi:uncharacterized SAM-binding protein YcdF (DUF218 family)
VYWATWLTVPRDAEVDPGGGDAVVVLGSPLDEHGHCTAGLAERVACGVRLYREGLAPLVVLTGGVSPGARATRPEAEGMADEAVRLGAPRNHLLVEPRARNTVENALYTAALLRERVPAARRVLLVTHAYHLRRALRLFRHVGVDAVPVLLKDSLLYEGGAASRLAARLLVREAIVSVVRAVRDRL